MNERISAIAVFANRHRVPAEHAHTLPAIFEKVAEIGNLPVASVINRATYKNIPLANYIKELAEETAKEVPV